MKKPPESRRRTRPTPERSSSASRRSIPPAGGPFRACSRHSLRADLLTQRTVATLFGCVRFPVYPKNGNEVGAAISITFGGSGLCRLKRSLFQLTQRVSLFPPPRSDLLIGNALAPSAHRLGVASPSFLGSGGAQHCISPLQGSDGLSSLPRALPEAVMRCPVGAPELPHSRNSFHAKFARMPAGACGHSRF